MNDSATIGVAMSVFFVALTGLCIYLQRHQRRKRVSILDFQKGLKYQQGKFIELLQPGVYAISQNENIVVMDMRVTPISFERLSVTTLDGVNLAASVTAKVQVTDPLQGHIDLLPKYTDADIHDLAAYLATLK